MIHPNEWVRTLDSHRALDEQQMKIRLPFNTRATCAELHVCNLEPSTHLGVDIHKQPRFAFGPAHLSLPLLVNSPHSLHSNKSSLEQNLQNGSVPLRWRAIALRCRVVSSVVVR